MVVDFWRLQSGEVPILPSFLGSRRPFKKEKLGVAKEGLGVNGAVGVLLWLFLLDVFQSFGLAKEHPFPGRILLEAWAPRVL